MAEKIKLLFTTIIDIFHRPGPGLGKVTKNKYWLPLLLFSMVFMALFFYIQFPLDVEQMTQNAKISGEFSEEQLLSLEGTPLFARLMTVIIKLLVWLLVMIVGAFFVYLFFGIAGIEGVYSNYFSLVVGASFIDILLPTFLRTFSLIFNTDITVFFVLTLYIPGLSPGSFPGLVLNNITLFSIWYTIALAAGVAVFAKKDFKKCLGISIFYFLFKIITQAAFAYIMMKIAMVPAG